MAQSARSAFAAQPGKTQPSAYSADATPLGPTSKSDSEEELAKIRSKLADFQEILFARGLEGDQRRILLVLQGMDTSGKGGVTSDVVTAFNPSGVHFASFKAPTPEELQHDFL